MGRSTLQTEVVIIGAGPGGYAAAFRAADLGLHVTLIDKNAELGGVCLNRGCIPSKALLHLAKVIDEAAQIKKQGIVFETPKIELEGVRTFKEKVVAQLSRGIAQMAKARGVQVIQGIATFASDKQLVIAGEDKDTNFKFDKAIIATGSRPATIPGISMEMKNVFTSTGALKLDSIPPQMLVIGGGYIGLEMGTVYSALGANVSVVEFMPNLLPGADQDMVKPLERKLKKEFQQIYLSTKVVKVEQNADESLKCTFETSDGKDFTETYNAILVSVGRIPNTDKLELHKTGIKPTDKGFITVNTKQQTQKPHIFAIGDVTGDPMLAHKSNP